MYKEWVLDISLGEPYAFVPYDRERSVLVLGLNVVTDRCPGSLVGIISKHGDEHIEEWIRENPDWRERYG